MTEPNSGESLGAAIAVYSDLLAGDMADDLAVHGKLFIPRERFIEQKRPELIEELLNQNLATQNIFAQIAKLLKAELENLPLEERKTYQEEFTKAQEFLTSIKRTPQFLIDHVDLLKKNSMQELLSFSNATLKWIYDVGYRLSQKEQIEEASLIFSFLVFLNALVSDYWIALGLTQLRLQKNKEALTSFSSASILNPSSPITRYNSAKIYLEMNQPDDALAELDALDDIIKAQNLSDLKPLLKELKLKAQQKTTS